MNGRFGGAAFNLIQTCICVTATRFEGYARATGVTDYESSRSDAIVQVTDDDRAVGSALLRRSEREATTVGGDADIWPGFVYL